MFNDAESTSEETLICMVSLLLLLFIYLFKLQIGFYPVAVVLQ
jgi:hypothetical protein